MSFILSRARDLQLLVVVLSGAEDLLFRCAELQFPHFVRDDNYEEVPSLRNGIRPKTSE